MPTLTRKVDELGRIVIPVDIRRVLGLKLHGYLTFKTEGDRIILEPALKAEEMRCPHCGKQL